MFMVPITWQMSRLQSIPLDRSSWAIEVHVSLSTFLLYAIRPRNIYAKTTGLSS